MIFSRIKGAGFLHKGSISFLSYCTHVGVWERSQVIQRQGYSPISGNIGKKLVITAGKKKLPPVDGSVTLWAEHLWKGSSNISGAIALLPATSSFLSTLKFNPPGYVFFKNIEICSDLSPSGSAEKYQRVLSNCPNLQILFLFRILVSELTNHNGAVSFYYPVTPTDSDAFRGFALSEDMYEFIKGKLKLKKGQFFSWFEEELKKNR